MSRSHRHTPIIAITTVSSEKHDKRAWNQLFRKRTRRALQRGDEALPVHIGKETEVCTGAKDGKMWFKRPATPEHDAYAARKLMRK